MILDIIIVTVMGTNVMASSSKSFNFKVRSHRELRLGMILVATELGSK